MKYLKFFRNKVLLILLLIALIVMTGCFGGLQITTSGLPDGQVGSIYDATIHANEYVDQWSISSGYLPLGINFNNGNFHGSPTTAGTSTFTVAAIQWGPGGEHAYKTFRIRINP
jgi:hypothetical protein